jgi:hypothetical protein
VFLPVRRTLRPAGRRVLEIQLAAKRGDIQKRIVADKPFDSALAREVREADILPDTEKHANSLALATLIRDFEVDVEVAEGGSDDEDPLGGGIIALIVICKRY